MIPLNLLACVLSASELSCPAGAVAKARTTKDASEKWCETETGVRHGPRHAWYADGAKWFTGAYEQGQRSGTWTFWYPSGASMSEGSYHQGKAEGRFVRWHETGKKAVEGTCEGGREQGRWTRYYPNGKPEIEMTFRAGKPVGAVRYWDRRGRPADFDRWIREKLRGLPPERFAKEREKYRLTGGFEECGE